MSTTFKQAGKVLELVAPRTLTSGQGALVGSVFGVAQIDVASAVSGPFMTEGVHTLAKTSAQAWVQGDPIYWDDTNHRCDNTAVGKVIGVATEAAASPSSTGVVKLVEGPLAPQAATFAALTDSSGGATADGTIGVVTLPTLAGWNGSTDPTAAEATQIITAVTACRDAIKELATKINEIRTNLRAAGIVA